MKIIVACVVIVLGTNKIGPPWVPKYTFHARFRFWFCFRPNTCRSAADEAPPRTREKTSGTHGKTWAQLLEAWLALTSI